ncbi:SDR family oxidoreductase [Thermodesulfobacteriota bacterium]
MKTLLITGASGFLGWHVCRAASKNWNVWGTSFSKQLKADDFKVLKIDLTDFKALKQLFRTVTPDGVIHTAAASDPEFCEVNPEETQKLNVDATVNIAGLCCDHDLPFVFTSSDLVFGGQNAPYKETDPVGPVSIYGEQKVAAENGILDRYPIAAVCRLPLMFGSAGPTSSSFIQPMLEAMKVGRPLNLFLDEFRTPTSVKAATAGLFLALERVKGIIHLGGKESLSRYDFGRLLARIFKMDHTKLIPCRQDDIKTIAPRPADVSLDSRKAFALGFNPSPLASELKKIYNDSPWFKNDFTTESQRTQRNKFYQNS